MLEVKTFEVNPLTANCYIVSDETKAAVIIDPGMFAEEEWAETEEYVSKNGLNVKHCLLTHSHFDHVMGCRFAERSWGLRPEGHPDDVGWYKLLDEQTEQFFQFAINIPEQPAYIKCHNDGALIDFGSHTLQVIHTPGHSKGGVCYYIENEKALFSGDTLFTNSMGRTDLWGGDNTEMMQSLQRLTTLPGDTVVYPGHGPVTTIDKETKWILAVCRR